MAGPTTHARANWAHDRATSLPEVWATAAKHLGVVGAWRLMLVCRGAKEFLGTLPGLVVRRRISRRGLGSWERRVAARPGDPAVGANACASHRAL